MQLSDGVFREIHRSMVRHLEGPGRPPLHLRGAPHLRFLSESLALARDRLCEESPSRDTPSEGLVGAPGDSSSNFALLGMTPRGAKRHTGVIPSSPSSLLPPLRSLSSFPPAPSLSVPFLSLSVLSPSRFFLLFPFSFRLPPVDTLPKRKYISKNSKPFPRVSLLVIFRNNSVIGKLCEVEDKRGESREKGQQTKKRKEEANGKAFHGFSPFQCKKILRGGETDQEGEKEFEARAFDRNKEPAGGNRISNPGGPSRHARTIPKK